jgi:uncharacterized protein (UPF0332 family)
MKEFAASEWKRAVLSLRSSKELTDMDPDSAASRAYYAAFHAVTALFALRDQEFFKHSAVRAAVHRDLVHGGEWDVELGQDYDFLMDLRETGDYGGLMHVSSEDARSAVEVATRILQAVDSVTPELARDSEFGGT